MTRTILHTVVKNEQHRFLEKFLEWHSPIFDEIHIFDDQSIDDTVQICKQYTKHVYIRKDSESSFVNNESLFRQAAWDNLGTTCSPTPKDWIICLDADEFFMSEKENEKDSLDLLLDYTTVVKKRSTSIRLFEVWKTNPTMIRIDGFWKTNFPVRITRWKPNETFANFKLGCGSVPEPALKNSVQNIKTNHIMHLGYSIDGTAKRKYDLYKSNKGNRHNPAHIESLLKPPSLIEWLGKSVW